MCAYCGTNLSIPKTGWPNMTTPERDPRLTLLAKEVASRQLEGAIEGLRQEREQIENEEERQSWQDWIRLGKNITTPKRLSGDERLHRIDARMLEAKAELAKVRREMGQLARQV